MTVKLVRAMMSQVMGRSEVMMSHVMGRSEAVMSCGMGRSEAPIWHYRPIPGGKHDHHCVS